MCCFFSAVILAGPRLGILIWWLVEPTRWEAAFSSFWWSFVGFIFAPWTTLMWVSVAAGGVVGFDWVILGLGVVADIASYSANAYERRETYTA